MMIEHYQQEAEVAFAQWTTTSGMSKRLLNSTCHQRYNLDVLQGIVGRFGISLCLLQSRQRILARLAILGSEIFCAAIRRHISAHLSLQGKPTNYSPLQPSLGRRSVMGIPQKVEQVFGTMHSSVPAFQ